MDQEGAGVSGSLWLGIERDSWGTSELSQPDCYLTIMAQGGLGGHWRMENGPLPTSRASSPGRETSGSHFWSLSVGTRQFPRQTPVQEQD